MRIKKEQIILALIIIVLILYLVFRKQDQINYQIPDLPKIPRAEFTSIEITRSGDSIVLEKQGEKWVISPHGYPTNTSNIKNMLDFIEEPTLTVMVSDSKNYTRYGLDNDKKIIVKAFAVKDLKREIEIGNSTDTRRNTFVKLAEDYRIYHAQGNQKNVFDKDMDELRDKIVLSFDQSEIKKIQLTKGPQSLILTQIQSPSGEAKDKEDTESTETVVDKVEWQTSEGEKINQSELEELLSTLSSLTCKAFLYEIKKEDLIDPVCVITLKGVKEYSLSLFPKTDDYDQGYPALSSENESPFLLTDWNAERIIESPDNIIKESEESDTTQAN